jgi:hypothetical protein
MWLEITSTTDGKFQGRTFDSAERPIVLDDDRNFVPDRVFPIGKQLWRLASTSYVIDAREVTNHA